MLRDVIKYVKYFLNDTKRRHPQINEVILKSALVYQYLYIKHYNEYMSIDDVIEVNNGEIGLIGPGNGYITWFLEKVFGWNHVLHSHSILHDAHGRFYSKYSLDRGYTYVIPENMSSNCMKRTPLCGQMIGLIYCSYHKIRI